jgi:hypothetical protein
MFGKKEKHGQGLTLQPEIIVTGEGKASHRGSGRNTTKAKDIRKGRCIQTKEIMKMLDN